MSAEFDWQALEDNLSAISIAPLLLSREQQFENKNYPSFLTQFVYVQFIITLVENVITFLTFILIRISLESFYSLVQYLKVGPVNNILH